ncbi:MAG TPA: RHS repeat-associated core domain-containing protein [Tahibacter sp.]|nr:RHS repeat-associated core domain-containing protein [Tahibacter sp.]
MPKRIARLIDKRRTHTVGSCLTTGTALALAAASAFAQSTPTPPQPRGTAGVPTYVEYDKKLRAAEQLSPLSGDMFGENVSLYTGQTEFSQVDIDLPGNNALPVQLRRRFVVTPLMQNQAWDAAGNVGNPYGGISNWDIDVPYIYGIFDATNKWDVTAAGSTPRCTSYFLPAVTQTSLSVTDVWSGNKVHVPGKGDKELLRLDATYPPLLYPADGRLATWTTSEYDAFTCTPTVSGNAGEGFVMTTPEGITYTFDVYRERHYAPVRAGASNNPRRMIFLLASKVADRYGNQVTYTYNDVGHPSSIVASARPGSAPDNRSITFSYDSGHRLQTASVTLSTVSAPGGPTVPGEVRTWTYAYEPEGLRRLKSVTLPDNLSQWVLDYVSLNGGGDPYLYVPYTEPPAACNPADLPTSQFGLRIIHPSGAKGDFTFEMTRHWRSNLPPNNCLTNGTFEVPPYADAFSLTSKRITSTDAANDFSQWSYAYPPSIGESVSTTTVTQPDGSTVTNRFSTVFEAAKAGAPTGAAIEGQLLGTTTKDANGILLQETENEYVSGPDTVNAPLNGYPFPSRYGTGGASEDSSAGSVRPLKSVTIRQQGIIFTKNHLMFDTYARPVQVRKSSAPAPTAPPSTPSYTKTESTVYRDCRGNPSHACTATWVLGLIDSVTDSTLPGSPMVSNAYDAIGNLTEVQQFGQRLRGMAYNPDGTVASVTDGAGLAHTTVLGPLKNGIPTKVTFADLTWRQALIDDAGDIRWVSDENRNETSYGYDKLSRLTSIIYPSTDSVTWNNTTIVYERVGPELGINATHWRQTQTNGTAKKVVHYDHRLRPVLTSEADIANLTSTLRYTRRGFDYANRETFVSYPSELFLPSAGTTTTYDALGRVKKTAQTSELGLLETDSVYDVPFTRIVTDPNDNVTTTTFQTFDAPSEDVPMKIVSPEGVTTTFSRDVFGKPLTMARSGLLGGKLTSQTRTYVYGPSDQRLCKTIEPESGAAIMDYDAAGNVAWSVKGASLTNTTCDRSSIASSDRTLFTYDARNRLTNVDFQNVATSPIVQTYWPDGSVKSVTSNGATWNYAYNKRGLLEAETLTFDAQTFLLDRSYDANGSLSQLMYPNDLIVDYEPNALGQPTRAGNYATSVSYWPNGAMKEFTYGNDIVHTLSLNDRLLPEKSKDGAISELTYGYDPNANVLSITDGIRNGEENRTLTYDGLNRLKTANAPGLWGAASYTYDIFDNLRTSALNARSCTHAHQGNRLTSISGTNCPVINYAYDALGRGNVTQRGGQAFSYDKADRLITAVGKESYTYDGLGRRVSIVDLTQAANDPVYQVYSKDGQLLFGVNAASGKTTSYIYLNGSLVARNESASDTSLPAQPEKPTFAPNPSPDGNYTIRWNSVSGIDTYVLTEVVAGSFAREVYRGNLLEWSPPTPRPNGEYTYRLVVCRSTYCSKFSSVVGRVERGVSVLTLAPNPSPNGMYTASWTAVGGATRYVLSEQVDGGAWTTAYDGSSLSWSPSGSKPDGTYAYRVQACNVVCGAYSATVTQSVRTPAPAEFGSDVNPSLNGNYRLSWQAVSVANWYQLQKKNADGSWSEVLFADALTKLFSGQANGNYTYQVRACRHATDTRYCGTFTAPLTVFVRTTPIDLLPPDWTRVSSSTTTDGNYTVTWASATNATSYKLEEKYEHGGNNWTVVATTTNREWSPSPPKSGYGRYYYRVQSCNASTCSVEYSPEVDIFADLPGFIPPRPVVTVISAQPNLSTDGTYTVTWNAAANATRYYLQENIGGTPAWTDIGNFPGTSWAPSAPRPNGIYNYKVKACNAYGCSDYSLMLVPSGVTVRIPSQLPMTTPTNFSLDLLLPVVRINDPYNFTWDPVDGADRYEIEQKDVHCPANNADLPLQVISANLLSFGRAGQIPDCGLTRRNDVLYQFSIRACNGVVCSAYSAPFDVTVERELSLIPRDAVETTTYIHTDALRSPIAESRANGTLKSLTRYEPYGATLTATVQGPGFTGHVVDAATGLVYMQQRYYDSTAGRFLTVDPVSADTANFNRYGYANNNPYKYVDPDGRVVKLMSTQDKDQLENMINERALGTFRFDKEGNLKMESSKGDASKQSQYYQSKLNEAIKSPDTITLDIGPVFVDPRTNEIRSLDSPKLGGGVTLGGKTGNQDVIVSGNPPSDGSGTAADVLAHELVGHAIPRLVGSDTGNAIANENKVRAETTKNYRDPNPKHVE